MHEKITLITSPQNIVYKSYSSLTNSKGSKKEGLFFLMGEKIIREFLRKKTNFEVVSEVITDGLTPIAGHKITYQFSKELFAELDTLGTHFNLLVLKVPEIQKFSDREPNGLEMMTPLGDPSNLGALIRSADAFGVRSIILTEESAWPFHPKSVKASAGSVLRVNFCKAGKSVDLNPKSIAALDMKGEPVDEFKWPKNIFLFVGEEGPGIGRVKSQWRISIKTENVESLNATVASSIALYEAAKNRIKSTF